MERNSSGGREAADPGGEADAAGREHEAGPELEAGPAPASEPTAHEEELEALRREAEENWNKYLRAVAELDNFRKRTARELETARKYAAERLGQAMLPVRDSLEAALAAADNVDVATLLEGERATLRLLDQAFESVGIREINPAGEAFDPTKHEAMTLQPTADAAPDTVVAVIQKGYELHDRLLRPARVVVAAPPPQGQG
ncbi:MAG TPA: nucleotide exchange factor GrpE [Gammaproteobacteria bacterium]